MSGPSPRRCRQGPLRAVRACASLARLRASRKDGGHPPGKRRFDRTAAFSQRQKSIRKSIKKRPEKHLAFLSVILCLCDATVLFLELLPYPPAAFRRHTFLTDERPRKDRVRPAAGRTQPKTRVSIARWNLKEAGYGGLIGLSMDKLLT